MLPYLPSVTSLNTLYNSDWLLINKIIFESNTTKIEWEKNNIKTFLCIPYGKKVQGTCEKLEIYGKTVIDVLHMIRSSYSYLYKMKYKVKTSIDVLAVFFQDVKTYQEELPPPYIEPVNKE
jgi:hypothetical protein